MNRETTSAEQLILQTLKDNTNEKTGQCVITQNEMAALYGCPKRQIATILENLETKRLISVERDTTTTPRKANKYTLTLGEKS